MQYAMYHMLRLHAQKLHGQLPLVLLGICSHVVRCLSPRFYTHIIEGATQECMHPTVGEDVLNERMNAHIQKQACHVTSGHQNAAALFLMLKPMHICSRMLHFARKCSANEQLLLNYAVGI